LAIVACAQRCIWNTVSLSLAVTLVCLLSFRRFITSGVVRHSASVRLTRLLFSDVHKNIYVHYRLFTVRRIHSIHRLSLFKVTIGFTSGLEKINQR